MVYGRSLNASGQDLHYRIHVGITTLLCIVMIFYAAFRGQRVVTQLPAVFRTTAAPKKLPLDFLNQLFQNNIPASNFEYPEMFVCPVHPLAKMNISNCAFNSSMGVKSCNREFVNIEGSYNSSRVNRTCIKITSEKVANIDDNLSLSISIIGLPQNSPSGVMISSSGPNFDKQGALQVVSAQSWALNEILVSKLVKINLQNVRAIEYEINNIVQPIDNGNAIPSVSQINSRENVTSLNSTNSTLNSFPPDIANTTSFNSNTSMLSSAIVQRTYPILIRVRYPVLEVTYEKAFLPLDMNNWLGEVGGVTALLFMLYTTVMKIVSTLLLKSGKYSNSDYVKGEEFERFS